jgi:hypothetical protein
VAEGISLKHYLRKHLRIHILCEEQENVQSSPLLRRNLRANSEGRWFLGKVLTFPLHIEAFHRSYWKHTYYGKCMGLDSSSALT